MATVLEGYRGNVGWDAIITSDSTWYTHSWSLTVETDAGDITQFNSTGWKEQVGVIKSWTATVEMYVTSDNQIAPSDLGNIAVGTFRQTSTRGYTGRMFLRSMNPVASVDGIQTQTCEFVGASDLSVL